MERYQVLASDDKGAQMVEPTWAKEKELAEVRLRAAMVPQEEKKALCEMYGWDPDDKISEELTKIDLMRGIVETLALGVEDFDDDDLKPGEVTRMMRDFMKEVFGLSDLGDGAPGQP